MSHSQCCRSFRMFGCLSLALICVGMLSDMRGLRAEDVGSDCQTIENPARDAQQFLEFIRTQARELRKNDQPPADQKSWLERRQQLREQLERAWGGFPKDPCPLEPKILGTLERDGYTVERLIFQTLPGVWMTANAYVPAAPGPHPAILSVHGHWAGAKQDPTVQKRCIGPAKLGYFVLCVDAFGAGERGLGKRLGEYHGEMVGAMLLPAGRPLSGIQVYENSRAVDYLLTRPEVDATRIGVTGASGGGNQTMYAGAWDERLRASVPVCSVGNYQAYLGAACCMCEVVPGALRFTEEHDILALTAPRALMVVNATQDAIQFSVAESNKSLARAESIFRLYDRQSALKHAVFEGPHDYSQPMREALYGWMNQHLRGSGDGSPVPDPPMTLEPPEVLRCFPEDSRPDDWMTIPRFAAAAGRNCPDRWTPPKSPAEWPATAKDLGRRLETVLGGVLQRVPVELRVMTPPADAPDVTRIRFTAEPGICLSCSLTAPRVKPAQRKVAILLDLNQPENLADPWKTPLTEAGWDLLQPTLRATGRFAQPGDRVGRAPDHNTAEWSLWLGRPLLGQWAWDVRRVIDALDELDGGLPKELVVIGRGPAGIVALTAAATDARITSVVSVDALTSFISEVPFQDQRLGLMVPGLLSEVGDVPLLAALTAPRRVMIAGGVTAAATPLTPEQLGEAFARTKSLYEAIQQPTNFQIVSSGEIIEKLCK